MSQMRKTLIGILVLGTVVVVLYSALVLMVAPRMLRSHIMEAVESACPSCELEFQGVSLAYFQPWVLTFQDIHLYAGHKGGSEAKVRLDSLEIVGNVGESTKENIVIESVSVDGPDVIFTDGDAVSKKSDDEEKSGPTFEIRKTELSHGKFTYIRNTKGTSATLHLHNVAGEIGVIGTDPKISKDMVNAHFRTQIEKSGEVELDVAALLRPGPDHVDVTVHIRDQNLVDLTPFFNPNAGVEIKGKLIKARGRVLVRGEEAKASVWVVYHGLDIKLNPMYDRTKAEAFFMNLGADLVMADEDLGLSKDEQTKMIQVKRESGERIVGFILRSLKEAAIGLARSAGPKSSPTSPANEKNAPGNHPHQPGGGKPPA